MISAKIWVVFLESRGSVSVLNFENRAFADIGATETEKSAILTVFSAAVCSKNVHVFAVARGIPVGFTLTAANIDERDAAYDMMEIIAGLLLGDKGYIRPEFKNDCQELGIDLQTPLRKNMKDKRP